MAALAGTAAGHADLPNKKKEKKKKHKSKKSKKDKDRKKDDHKEERGRTRDRDAPGARAQTPCVVARNETAPGSCWAWLREGKCEKPRCPHKHLPEEKGSQMSRESSRAPSSTPSTSNPSTANSRDSSRSSSRASTTSTSSASTVPSDRVCYNCGEKGHYARDCTKLDKRKGKGAGAEGKGKGKEKGKGKGKNVFGPRKYDAQGKAICNFFLNGTCWNGKDCAWSRNPEASAPVKPGE